MDVQEWTLLFSQRDGYIKKWRSNKKGKMLSEEIVEYLENIYRTFENAIILTQNASMQNFHI